MLDFNCAKIISECGVPVDSVTMLLLDEAAQLKVTDDVLTGMLKFITDKYNSMDFSMIEKSAGDFAKFAYKDVLRDNVEILNEIYSNSPDPGAKKYMEVVVATTKVMDHLMDHRQQYSDLYRSGNGIVQLLYTSMVSACIYSVGILISNTIRFVTTEQDTECSVMFDEIPGTIKHVHIRNILSAANSLNEITDLLNRYSNQTKNTKPLKESIEVGTVAIAIVGIGAVLMLIPKIIVLIREIIYSIYYTRVRVSEMLNVQIDLINTNIESLQLTGRGNKKIIARQRKIVDKLTKWKNIFSVKVDTTNSMVSVQKEKENRALKVDRNSPIVRNPDTFDSGSLML